MGSSKKFRSSRSFPGLTHYAEVTPGSDHSSPRAEIHAVYLALVLSEGSLCIVSDCAYVVTLFGGSVAINGIKP